MDLRERFAMGLSVGVVLLVVVSLVAGCIAQIEPAATATPPATPALVTPGSGASDPNRSPSPSPSPTASPTPPPTDDVTATPASTPAPTPTTVASGPAQVTGPPDGSPEPTPFDVSPFLTARMSVLNLTDEDIELEVTYVDEDSGDRFPLPVVTVATFEYAAQDVPAGTYELEFRDAGTADVTATCTLVVEDGDGYEFAAVDGAIAIARVGYEPTLADEVFVHTSSLCGIGG